tara:strand:- start:3839 stop:5191 length:1353 start_codon:yes stop_codon:yes gene_type:complete
MASAELTRTFSSGNRRTFTFSAWVKVSQISSDMCFFQSGTFGSGEFWQFNVQANGGMYVQGRTGSTDNTWLYTSNTKFFRDPSAWQHWVVAVDTTQATEANRVKIYKDGVQFTNFESPNYPSQDYEGQINTASSHGVGGRVDSSGANFDGLMAHVHFTDGTAYTPSTFGETDSTSGIWKPKSNPSVTYGTNGFFLKFENSGAMGTDSSGNSNTFSVTGTITQNIDTPSNNFATMNPLDNYYTVNSFSNANNTVTTPNSGYSGAIAGMGANSGKYYFEFKPISKTGDSDEYAVGITGAPVTSTNQPHWKIATGYMYGGVNGNVFNNDSGSAYGSAYTAGDIIGVAMDLDNNKLYFSKNGTWQNSGDPTSGSTGTGATSITAASSTPIGFYLPCCAFASNSYGAVMAFNFGSGYFQTTAVSSAGTAPSEGGIFEYDCPSGYQALCTKGINSF